MKGPRLWWAGLLALAVLPAGAAAQSLLVPMDRTQQNHLRAYGLTYWALESGHKGEWLLNYRGGSFVLPDAADVRREAALRGVTLAPLGVADEARMRAQIEDSNMEAVPLEKAPKVAIYTPPNSTPWDDAVTMALTLAWTRGQSPDVEVKPTQKTAVPARCRGQ